MGTDFIVFKMIVYTYNNFILKTNADLYNFSNLIIKNQPVYKNKASYKIRIQSTDSYGNKFTNSFLSDIP